MSKLQDKIKNIKPGEIVLYAAIFAVLGGVVGFGLRSMLAWLEASLRNEQYEIDWKLILNFTTWIVGWAFLAILVLIVFVIPAIDRLGFGSSRSLAGRAEGIDSPLENSRFLTEKEREKYFPACTYETLGEVKKDGVPVRAIVDRKGKMHINFLSGAHSLVIGATGERVIIVSSCKRPCKSRVLAA